MTAQAPIKDVTPIPWAGPREVIKVGAFDRSKVNVLIRGEMAVQLSPYLIPVAREVYLSADPIQGEVYPLSQRKAGDRWVASELGISALGLEILGTQAGIVDVTQASGRVDGGRDPHTCTYRATMAMRLPDGQWTAKTRECTQKLATIAKDIRAAKTKKAEYEKWDARKLEAEIAKELLLKEKFLERLAETGAKSRCVRALLGIKQKWTPEELSRPFVVAGVVTDMSQPELRQAAMQLALGAQSAVFGPTGDSASSTPRQLLSGPSAADVQDDADTNEAAELDDAERTALLGLDADDVADAAYREVASNGGTHTVDAGTGEVVASAEGWLDDEQPAIIGRLQAALAANTAGTVTDVEGTALAEATKGLAKLPVLRWAFGTMDGKDVTDAHKAAVLKVAHDLGEDAFRQAWSKAAEAAQAAGK